jgi:N-methylhydantoinase A
LGGEVKLERNQAKRAIVKYVADPLGMDLYEAAAGILDIVNNNMVGALKVVSVEKGYDPGEFALIAFGGAGPMHASELSRQLGTKTVVIPALPGILCAVGLLSTDLQYDYVRTCLQRAPEYDLELMRRVFGELSTLAQQGLNEEGVPETQRRIDWLADVRYAKQGYEITVQLPMADVDAETVSLLVEDFHQRHEQLYTFCDREAAVEIVNLRIKAIGIVDKLELSTVDSCNGSDAKPRSTREVYFSDRGFQTTPVYAREDLLAGHTLKGPAIVDQLDTTTVVFPREIARVDPQGAIFIEINHE